MNRTLLLVSSVVLASCSSDDGSSLSSATVSSALPRLGLDTLNTAVAAAGLDDDLADPNGTLTLFAPTDEAFAKVDPATLNFLLDPANQAALVNVLSYHTLGAEADSTAASALPGATPLGGGDLLLDVVGGELFVNEARVVEKDLDVSNGIIHKIDTVLTPPSDIVSTLVQRDFGTLVAAVQAAGLDAALAGPGPFTVLAPTDAAFAALPAGTLDALLQPANQADLVELLTYHVVPSAVRASEALAVQTPASLEGRKLLFDVADGEVSVNGVAVSVFNVPCTNGVIHVVDAVLLPPESITALASDLGFSTLSAALVAAGLDDDLAHGGEATVFAPTDQAFAALDPTLLDALLQPANQAELIQILTYHVVPGTLTARDVLTSTSLTTLEGSALTVGTDPARVDDANLVVTDVLAANGVVHAIDAVLVPPGFVLPRVAGAPSSGEPSRAGDLSRLDLPGWTGARTSGAAVWASPSPSRAGVAPTAPEGVSVHSGARLVTETPGALFTDEALRFPDLDARVRLDVPAATVPFEVVVDVLGRGFDPARASLHVFDGATVLEQAPQAVEPFEGGFRVTWSPLGAGAPADGLDVVLHGEGGSELRSVRFLDLR